MRELAHRTAAGDGVELHYVEAGAGPPVVLIHGFPDFWFGWRHQIPVLADAGFHVIALDLRGFNRSARPRGIDEYSMQRLGGDLIRFIGQVAPDGAFVVGHDWGGVLAWRLAAQQPLLCRATCIINAPHPDLYRRALLRNPRQLLRSWYVGFSQLPRLPEFLLSAGDFALLRRLLATGENGRPQASSEEIREYLTVFAREYALTAALNYYRAAARDLFRRRSGLRNGGRARVSTPMLVIWGEQDRALDSRLLDGLEHYAPHLAVKRIANAGHFVHWQRPELVNRLLLEWLRRQATTGSPDSRDASGTGPRSGR